MPDFIAAAAAMLGDGALPLLLLSIGASLPFCRDPKPRPAIGPGNRRESDRVPGCVCQHWVWSGAGRPVAGCAGGDWRGTNGKFKLHIGNRARRRCPPDGRDHFDPDGCCRIVDAILDLGGRAPRPDLMIERLSFTDGHHPGDAKLRLNIARTTCCRLPAADNSGRRRRHRHPVPRPRQEPRRRRCSQEFREAGPRRLLRRVKDCHSDDGSDAGGCHSSDCALRAVERNDVAFRPMVTVGQVACLGSIADVERGGS